MILHEVLQDGMVDIMTELLQPFNPNADHPSEDIFKASQLLHEVTARPFVATSEGAVVDELNAYDTFLGGKLGSFAVHRDEASVIRALTYVIRYKDSMELVALSVDRERRSRGLGARVLGELIVESNEDQVPIWLHTGRGNARALRLFGKAGFTRLPDSDYRQDPASSFVAMERPPESL